MTLVPVPLRLSLIAGLICLFVGNVPAQVPNFPELTPRPAPIPWVPEGKAVANDLQRSVSGMDQSMKYDSIEPLVERTVRLHSNDWRVLFQASRIYAELERSGYWIEGRYRRGDMGNSPPKGARRVHSHKRDHVRALQLLDRAIRLASTDSSMIDKADFYWEAAQIMAGEKGYLLMYDLTDLSKLPTLEFQEPRLLNREPVPMGENGQPQFFELPITWDAARNDGERLLWLLARARSLKSEYEAEAEFIHAKHLLKGYFGVQTVTESPNYDPTARVYDDSSETTKAILDSVDQLPKTQSIAVLDGGVQRIELPEEHNFIERLERISRDVRYRSHATLALEELAEIYENRRQYDRAAHFWKLLVQLSGGSSVKDNGSDEDDVVSKSWEEERLYQIVNSWGRFEDVHPVQVGEPLNLAYWYRNGRQANFTAHRVDVTALVADLRAYLRSDPFPIDPSRISVSKLGLNIVREGGDRYLKEKVSEWSQVLNPSEKHWDQRVEVPVPIDKPGAYLVEAKIDGGHRSSVLVWINDMTILRRPLEDGLFYYVADKKNGTPVGWAKFTFVGYRLSLVNQQAEPELDVHGAEIPEALRRQYHVLTKEITKWADAKGQLILDDAMLEPDYRWFLLTTAPGDRVSVLGFSDLKPTGTTPHQEFVGLRHYTITDKSAYLPGQDCQFKGWLREKQTTGGSAYAVPASTPVRVLLLNRRDEEIADLATATDAQGSYTGAFTLPADLIPGTYRLVTRCHTTEGQVEFFVEPNKPAPARLLIENPVRQLLRGETWRLTVRAEDAEGKWLAYAPLKYRVVRRRHQPTWKRDEEHAWLYGKGYDVGTPSYRWFPGWKYWGWDWNAQEPGEDIVVSEGLAMTSSDGAASLVVPTDSMRDDLRVEEDYRIEVGLEKEPSMEPITATVTVSERSYRVYAKLDQSYYEVGSSATFEAWARRYDGAPVTGKGELILYRIHYDGSGKPIESGWRKPLDTDKNGHVRSTFPVIEAGQYRVSYTMTDAEGDRFEGAVVFIVTDDKFTGEKDRFNSLEILADRVIYKPGDRARLRFNTENLGQTVAVFVRPRDGVFGKAEVLRFDQKSTPYEVYVKEEDQPSFTVEAILLNNGEFEVHTKEIYVSPPSPVLKVSITAKRADFRPGEEATFVVTLTDAQDQPISGDVTFALTTMDSAQCDNALAAMPKAFWDQRSLYEASVEHGLKTTFQSFSSPPEASMRLIGIFGSLRVSEPLEFVEDVGLEDQEPVVEEDLIAFASAGSDLPVIWRPSVLVDASGKAEISLTLPEMDGEWVARVWAINGQTQVGAASLPIKVKRAWSVDFGSPSSVVEGDRFDISASVRNRSGEPARAVLRLKVSEGISVTDGAHDNAADVAAEEVYQARWEALAQHSGEDAMLELQLGEGETMEVRKRSMHIRERRDERERWWNSLLEGEGESAKRDLVFTLPSDVSVNDSSLTIQASSGLFEQLVPAFGRGAMTQALSHDHEEEVLAAAVPVLSFGVYARGLDEEARQQLSSSAVAWVLEDGRMESFAQSVLERVWAQQKIDGGWGRYGAASEALSTTAVLDSLATLKPLGIATLPKERVKLAAKRLTQFQNVQRIRLEGGGSDKKASADTLDAYTYLTLLRHGTDNGAMRGLLFRDWKKLTILGETILTQALHLRGDTEKRNTIRFFLGEKLVKNEKTGAIQLKPDNEKFWWTWYGSNAEVQARYLDFLVRVKGDAPVTAAAAQQLLITRKRTGFWGATRDSGQALIALLRYASLKKAAPSKAKAQTLALWQGDQKILESVIGPESKWNGHTLVLSGADLEKAGRIEGGVEKLPLRLVYSGADRVSAHGHLTVVLKPTLIGENRGDLSIRRRYVRPGSDQAMSPGDSIAMGETVEVVLTVKSNRPMDHLSIVDHLPAGFEIVGELPNGWSHADDELSVHLPELEAETEFRYAIKATAGGLFHALPARLKALYLARLKAISEEMVLLVR